MRRIFRTSAMLRLANKAGRASAHHQKQTHQQKIIFCVMRRVYFAGPVRRPPAIRVGSVHRSPGGAACIRSPLPPFRERSPQPPLLPASQVKHSSTCSILFVIVVVPGSETMTIHSSSMPATNCARARQQDTALPPSVPYEALAKASRRYCTKRRRKGWFTKMNSDRSPREEVNFHRKHAQTYTNMPYLLTSLLRALPPPLPPSLPSSPPPLQR